MLSRARLIREIIRVEMNDKHLRNEPEIVEMGAGLEFIHGNSSIGPRIEARYSAIARIK